MLDNPCTRRRGSALADCPGCWQKSARCDFDEVKISPDRKRSVTCRNDGAEIAVKELPGGPERVFAVHRDDRADIAAQCVSWAGPKRLEYRANVRGWLDVDTMKIGGTLDDEVRSLEYDSSFTWVVESGSKSARIGRITNE